MTKQYHLYVDNTLIKEIYNILKDDILEPGIKYAYTNDADCIKIESIYLEEYLKHLLDTKLREIEYNSEWKII